MISDEAEAAQESALVAEALRAAKKDPIQVADVCQETGLSKAQVLGALDDMPIVRALGILWIDYDPATQTIMMGPEGDA